MGNLSISRWFLFPCWVAFLGWIQIGLSLLILAVFLLLLQISHGLKWGKINLNTECAMGRFPWSCNLLPIFFYFIVGGVLFALIYAASAFWFKCPHCKQRILVDWHNKFHPNAKRKLGMVGFGSIILQTIFEKRFTCSKCGEACLLNGGTT